MLRLARGNCLFVESENGVSAWLRAELLSELFQHPGITKLPGELPAGFDSEHRLSIELHAHAGAPVPVAPVVPSSGQLLLPTGVSAVGIPLNRKTAYVDMYNLSVQRELTPNLSLQIAYVGNIARHLYSFYRRERSVARTRPIE
jgi:hypothetical protein